MAGESINHLNIMLGIDAAGVRRGFKTAAEEARHFQKQLEQLQYESSKNIPKMYGPDATIFKAERDRRAREEAEYNQRMAVETAERERRLADETFQRNLRHIQQLHNRQLELANLRQDIMQRMAQQDADARQAAINSGGIRFGPGSAANAPGMNISQQMDADIAAREAANQQFTDSLRDRLATEARLERARQLDAKQAQRLADMEALDALRRANQARERELLDAAQNEIRIARTRSEGILRTIRRQESLARQDREQTAARDARRMNDANVADARRVIEQNRTATERYSAALARLDYLLHNINTATGRALLTDAQYAREKTRLTIATIRQQQATAAGANVMQQYANGAGNAAMAMGQMSFAVEDFIQVMSMGGTLNTALMSASNNLSMVVRSLLPWGGLIGSIAGVAVPVLMISIGMLIRSWMSEEEQVDAVTRAYRRLKDEMDRLNDARKQARQHMFNMEDIAAIKTAAEAVRELMSKERERLKLEDDILAKQEEIELKRKEIRDSMAGGTIVADAEKILRIMEQMQSIYSEEDLIAAREEVNRLKEAYMDLADTIATGTSDEMIRSAEELKEVIDSLRHISNPIYNNLGARLDTILESGDDDQNMTDELRNMMGVEAAMQQQLLDNEKELKKLQEEKVRLKAEEVDHAFKTNQWRREELLLMMRATDAQKAQIDAIKELEQFLGPNGMEDLGVMIGVDQIAIEFLEERIKSLNKELTQTLTPEAIGGLEQNAFTAQAKAFEQMMKKPNDQNKQIIERIDATNRLLNDIKNGNALNQIAVVP